MAFALTLGTVEQRRAQLRWTGADVGATIHWRGTGSGNTHSSSVGSEGNRWFTGLTPGTDYSIRGIMTGGSSGTVSSPFVSFTTLAASPDPPMEPVTPPAQTPVADGDIYRLGDFKCVIERDGESDLVLDAADIVAFEMEWGAEADESQPPTTIASRGQLVVLTDDDNATLAGWTALTVSKGSVTYFELKIPKFDRNHDKGEVTFQLQGYGSATRSERFEFSIPVSPTVSWKADRDIFPGSTLVVGDSLYGFRATGQLSRSEYPRTFSTTIADLAEQWGRFASCLVLESVNVAMPRYTSWKLPLTTSNSAAHRFQPSSSIILRPFKLETADWEHDAWDRNTSLTDFNRANFNQTNINFFYSGQNQRNRVQSYTGDRWFWTDEHALILRFASKYNSYIAGTIRVTASLYEVSRRNARDVQVAEVGKVEAGGRINFRVKIRGREGGFKIRVNMSGSYYYTDEELNEEHTVLLADGDSDKLILAASRIPSWYSNDENEAFADTAEYTKIQNVLKLWDVWKPQIVPFETIPITEAELKLVAGSTVRISVDELDHIARLMRVRWSMRNLSPLRISYTAVVLNPAPASAPVLNYVTLDGQRVTLDGEPVTL